MLGQSECIVAASMMKQSECAASKALAVRDHRQEILFTGSESTHNVIWNVNGDDELPCRKTCGLGPGFIFAQVLQSRWRYPYPVGLIPCAIGGSCIDEWQPGNAHYVQMVRLVSSSMQALLVRA